MAWGLFHRKFFSNLRPFGRNLPNITILRRNLLSKFGLNYKSVIYISLKIYGIGPISTWFLSVPDRLSPPP